MKSVANYNPEFVFDDIAYLSEKAVVVLLKETERKSLLLALKTAPEAVRTKIRLSIGQLEAKRLEKELRKQGPRQLYLVEAAQAEMVGTARRLAQEGKILLMNASARQVLQQSEVDALLAATTRVELTEKSEKLDLLKEINRLKSILSEYEVIEDDLANLKKFQVRNTQLEAENAKLKSAIAALAALVA